MLCVSESGFQEGFQLLLSLPWDPETPCCAEAQPSLSEDERSRGGRARPTVRHVSEAITDYLDPINL